MGLVIGIASKLEQGVQNVVTLVTICSNLIRTWATAFPCRTADWVCPLTDARGGLDSLGVATKSVIVEALFLRNGRDVEIPRK